MAKSNPLRPHSDKPARRSSTFGATIAADLLRAAPTSSASQLAAESDPSQAFSGKQSYVRELSPPSGELPDVVRIPTTPGFRVPLPGAFGEGAAAAKSAEQARTTDAKSAPARSASAQSAPSQATRAEANALDDAESEPLNSERGATYPEHVDSDDTNDLPFSESPAALAADLLVSGGHSMEPANDRAHAQSERPPVSKRETSVDATAGAPLDPVPPSKVSEEDAEQAFAKILERSSDTPPLLEGSDFSQDPLIEPLAAPPSFVPPAKRYGAVTLAAVFVGVCAAVLLFGQLWTSASGPAAATEAHSADMESLTERQPATESNTARASAAESNAARRGSTADTPASFTQAVRFEDLPSDTDSPTAESASAPTDTEADGVNSTNQVAERDTSATASVKAEESRAEPGTRGTLAVNSIPASNVYIDGRHVGHTPKLGLSVSAGAHEIKLEHPRHGTHTQIVKIEVDKKRVLSHRF